MELNIPIHIHTQTRENIPVLVSIYEVSDANILSAVTDITRRVIIIPIIILTIPIWLPVITYTFETIINAGRIVGTGIRIINSNKFCLF